MMVLPIEIDHFEFKCPKFSGRRRRPKILASGADLRNLSSENKGGFQQEGFTHRSQKVSKCSTKGALNDRYWPPKSLKILTVMGVGGGWVR